MDPLSSILSMLKPRNHLAAGLEAGGDWSVAFPPREDGIKTGAIVSGSCWLSVEGEVPPLRLEAGDCFLLPGGRPFRLGSDPTLRSTPAEAVFGGTRRGAVAVLNGGGPFSLVSNRFSLAGDHGGLLMRMLPAIVHIREPSERAMLRWSIERMMTELRDPQPGGALIVEHLAQMMLVQALRLHLAHPATSGVGWLFALADRQMNAVLTAMHDAPAHPWTLGDLAARAGMSRSAFALKFRQTVGVPPMDYLTRWRMMLAGGLLATAAKPISAIAPEVGYRSEAAFGTAFRRVMGCSPRRYAASGQAGGVAS